MSVSFELELGQAIRDAAARSGMSVSAWLAEAARDRLRLAALDEAIGAWEEQYGALTDAEIEEAEEILESASRSKRRRSVA